MMRRIIGLGLLAGLTWATPALAQEARCPEPACAAVAGGRTEGWAAQSRAEVIARNGMVTSSQPLATQAGLAILRKGGNAVDAAVATAAVLGVVEPFSTGIASDLFMIVWVAKEKKLYALNAAGTAPTGATPARYAELDYGRDPKNWTLGSGMPPAGILTVTVPGAVWGWDAALKRFGSMGFADVLTDAEYYARDGFPVSPRIADDWTPLPRALPLKACCTDHDPDTLAVWTPGGKGPKVGEMFRNPGLARAFALLRKDGPSAFYTGDIGRAIIAKSQALGGTMTAADLAGYAGRWVDLVQTRYQGHDIFELPPPSQSWGALEMLNILEACVPVWSPGQTLASLGPRSPRYWHYLIEAKKLAYADLAAWNGDPRADRKAVAGIKFGIGQHIGKAHAAKAFQRRIPAPHCARHGNSENAARWHARTQRPVLGILAIAQFGKSLRRRAGGGGASGVEGVKFLFLRYPDDHEQIAGDAGAERFDYAQHRHCRHRRVHRIPTLAQDGEPDLGGQRLAGGDHAVARNHLGPALRRPAFGAATGHGSAGWFGAACLLRHRWRCPRQASEQAETDHPADHLASPPYLRRLSRA